MDDVFAMVSPVKVQDRGITFANLIRVVSALGAFLDQGNLFYVQRFGIFDTGRMVAWGSLNMFPDGTGVLGAAPSGAIEVG